MVSITTEQVADALHTSTAELPTGASADIEAAEAVVGDQVEPYSDNSTITEQVAVYVACAFITGTEDSTSVSQIDRETATISFDTASASPEALDFWSRAKAVDTTNRLGTDTASFKTLESSSSTDSR